MVNAQPKYSHIVLIVRLGKCTKSFTK